MLDRNKLHDIICESLKVILNENKFDDEYNSIREELKKLRDDGIRKYGNKFWYSTPMMKYHPEIEVDPSDLERYHSLHKRYLEIEKMWKLENEREEEKSRNDELVKRYLSNRDNMDESIIDLAVDYYGKTYQIRDAGYILPDGSLLNFHRNGDALDHRNIAAVYDENDIPIWSYEYRYNYVVDFMNHGAIRCDVNSGILDMTVEPSDAQYKVIKQFVRIAGDVDVDFTNEVGDTQHSVSYSDVNPNRVVSDIWKYYNDGIRPIGNINEGLDKIGVVIESVINKLKEKVLK